MPLLGGWRIDRKPEIDFHTLRALLHLRAKGNPALHGA